MNTKGLVGVSLLLGLVLLVPISSSAAPSVGALSASPGSVIVNTPTTLLITVPIDDPTLTANGAILQRINANGTVTNLGAMRDDGQGGDATAGDRIFTFRLNVNEPQPGKIRLKVSAAFRGFARRLTSQELGIAVGVVLPPDGGGTIAGAGGTALTVPQGSFDVELVVGIAPAPPNTIVAPTGNLPLVTAVDVIIEPTGFDGSILPPDTPISIAVPAPTGTPDGALFIVALQAPVDSANGSGLAPRLLSTAAATSAGGRIVTTSGPLPGIVQPGSYAVVTATGSGFVTGIVSDAGGPVAGAIVSSDTNPLVALTDVNGQYALFVSGGPFTLTAFHPLKGSTGTTTGTIVTHGSTVNAPITLTPLATPVVTRDGIRNGGFERCADLDASGNVINPDGAGNITGSWAFTGGVQAVRQFGPTSTGRIITPTEGKCMAQISTAGGASGGIGSTLTQRFIIPAGVRTLTFDYNFVSEEFDEFVGSAFNDTFRAVITTPEGQATIAKVELNDFWPTLAGFNMIGDCLLDFGDETCGEVGWRTATLDLARFASEQQPVTVDLSFSVADQGDNLYETRVFIDNIRFGTIWVDAKIISGASSNALRVEQDIRGATEVLSQAGLNVRLRRQVSIPDPGGLDVVDITFAENVGPCADPRRLNGMLTAEERLVIGLSRSTVATDVNLYYVITGNRGGIVGYAIGSDEFCFESVLQNNGGGILLMDGATGRFGVLGHEIGHLTVAPDNARSTAEHSIPDPTNIMIGINTPPNGIVNRQQSSSINRLNSPVIVP